MVLLRDRNKLFLQKIGISAENRHFCRNLCFCRKTETVWFCRNSFCRIFGRIMAEIIMQNQYSVVHCSVCLFFSLFYLSCLATFEAGCTVLVSRLSQDKFLRKCSQFRGFVVSGVIISSDEEGGKCVYMNYQIQKFLGLISQSRQQTIIFNLQHLKYNKVYLV